MPPTHDNGKICYIEIPAFEVARSSEFYAKFFGCHLPNRVDACIAFDYRSGQVSGTWVLGRKASADVGMLTCIMVMDAAATVKAITAAGGEIVQPLGADAPEITARFRDPAGNVLGIYQDRG